MYEDVILSNSAGLDLRKIDGFAETVKISIVNILS